MDTPLIPRKLLFGNPDKASVQVSPDGQWISWLAPRDGRLNVYIAPRDDPAAARPVTHDTGRGIRFYGWTFTGETILFIQDKGGDENWRIYSANIHTEEIKDLTPFDGVQARGFPASPKFPGELLISLNNRDPRWHDVYRLDFESGELTLVLQNDRFADIYINDDYQIILASQSQPDGGTAYFRKSGQDWEEWDSVPQEDAMTTHAIGFDKSSTKIYMVDSRDRNTSALFIKDLASGSQQLVAEDPRADVGDVMAHPTEKNLQAVSFTYERKRWQVLDPAVQPDVDALSAVADGEMNIVSRSQDDRWWIVEFNLDNSPLRFYLYDRETREARFLFTIQDALQEYPLAKMYPAVFPASDGMELVAYYTLPPGSDADGDGKPDQPLPMVLTPHGGPWGRDYWGFNNEHQWLANRGYAVMSINFRSSTGFGKAFVNAGDKEFGGKIIGDQFDAVQWAIRQGIADPERVAIMGGSFGGYSTLAGLTFYPEVYACGVDIVGPSNLVTLLESIPPYWAPMIEMFSSRVGDLRTEEGRALLKKHSPLTYADRIIRPLLIAQGANDPRVKRAESDQIVAAMQEKNIPVTYVLYPDEGHGFARPENNLSFYAIAEVFLANCLNGRVEPIGRDFEGSSIEFLAGKESIPGI
jgi:dipeptidyl aminopeptidase/acylaminoacyl peptidase